LHQVIVFFRDQPVAALFVQEHRRAKLGSYAVNLAAMDGLIDFHVVAAAVDADCLR